MLYISFRYNGIDEDGRVISDTGTQVFDVDEPSTPDEIDQLEELVAAEIHKSVWVNFLELNLLNWKKIRRSDPYDILSRLPWIDVNDRPFPVFDREKESIDSGDFLAAWIRDGQIEGIEWYTYLGDGEFWNQNSNNLNEFNEEHELKRHRGPTHWLPVPRGNLK